MNENPEQNPNQNILTYEGICITASDLKCLEAREYINDNIINFWLKYMWRTILNDDQQQRILICDSHFMEALEKMDSERTYRWLRKMKLLEKDFLIIPVMEDEHWFLMTLQYPNNAYKQNEHGQRYRTRVRFWDSMGHDYLRITKKKLCQILCKFVRNAFLYEKSVSINDVHNIETIHEDVERQENLYDCGLHLLANAEDFICESFDVRHINPPDDDEWIILLNRKHKKRSAIRNLIRRLGQNQTVTEHQDDDGVELIS